jgi:carboxylate-amine ligase
VSGSRPLHLFEAFGIELEYMIVDRRTLAVRPIADRLIAAEVGTPESEIERGDVAWSNELALHVIELKTNGPAPALAGLAARFQEEVEYINRRLEDQGARLMPTGMHPWMDPHAEFALWPHEYSPVYEAFHRIFDCRGHGWANLQSAHLNLPFCGDEEFGRLHAAIRIALPLLPALAASTPVADGRASGGLDARLAHYAANAARVPSVTGAVVPEPVFTRADYERAILAPIYEDLAPLDPAGTLRHEWVNARGCIARFDRDAIEIRVLDVQECPLADLAVAAATTGVVQALAEGELGDPERQRRFETDRLAAILAQTAARGDEARLDDAEYLEVLGHPGGPRRAGRLWEGLIERTIAREPGFPEWEPALAAILGEGCLARRIRTSLGGDLRRERLAEVYGALCHCLATGTPFRGRS